ncbi:hypothetical protein IR083_21070 [Dysgonomonas sp. GY75]|uniref:hypothetical protein n=1 Tax=Dysgonomonas sp. GY75 TaxID=2780419 RepID=UPI001883506B|nr:hypothetical protein [Dysgonomonas sp. GY75]MBF0651313.1 hypothetical protein [Dysgonomonas sp. GY75]
MEDFKGTKKEWYIGEHRQNGIQIGCSQSHYVACAYRGGVDRTDDEVIANAQLIAAAPMLLFELQELVRICKANSISVDSAKYAINKALGKEDSHE